jgi:hypothetical protein
VLAGSLVALSIREQRGFNKLLQLKLQMNKRFDTKISWLLQSGFE